MVVPAAPLAFAPDAKTCGPFFATVLAGRLLAPARARNIQDDGTELVGLTKVRRATAHIACDGHAAAHAHPAQGATRAVKTTKESS